MRERWYLKTCRSPMGPLRAGLWCHCPCRNHFTYNRFFAGAALGTAALDGFVSLTPQFSVDFGASLCFKITLSRLFAFGDYLFSRRSAGHVVIMRQTLFEGLKGGDVCQIEELSLPQKKNGQEQ